MSSEVASFDSEKSHIKLIQYYGGDKRGIMININHICFGHSSSLSLTVDECKKLEKVLRKWRKAQEKKEIVDDQSSKQHRLNAR